MNRVQLENSIREEFMKQLSVLSESEAFGLSDEEKQAIQKKRAAKKAKGGGSLTTGLKSMYSDIDKGSESLIQKAMDATVGKIFKMYFKNKKKEAAKEAEKQAKKEKDNFDFADFQSEFEPDDAARATADQFVKQAYSPPAQDLKKCIQLGRQKKDQGADFDMSGKQTCAQTGKWNEIDKDLEEPQPSYNALSQQFKQDGVDDDVSDIMAKPPKVKNRFDQVVAKMAKSKAKKAKKKTSQSSKEAEAAYAASKRYMENKKGSHGSLMESWRRFSEEK